MTKYRLVYADGSTDETAIHRRFAIQQARTNWGASAFAAIPAEPDVVIEAPRPDAERFRKLRATLATAHDRMHRMMHRHGVFHDYTPIHDHHQEQEN